MSEPKHRIVTTGIQDESIFERLEIRELFKDKDATNLYILAIKRMQETNQDDPNSWYQLASIHGRPFIPYDNVGKKTKTGKFGGYCTHSSILFPTWHRPYLALFEQILSKHAFDIASEYTNSTDKVKYIAAARRLRIPYWDWASEITLPDIIATELTVSVYIPPGRAETVPNPLYAYKFHPNLSDPDEPVAPLKKWLTWTSTRRHPKGNDEGDETRPLHMQAVLKNNAYTIRERTHYLLTMIKTYDEFSHDVYEGKKALGEGEGKGNMKVFKNPGLFDSIEAIHGSIHIIAGGIGHMGEVDYAAHDPIFWLHHVNVDRLFAIWQVLNPDVFVGSKPTELGNYDTEAGMIEDAKSPLKPFYASLVSAGASEDRFWNSDDVRDTRTFKYTYPELKEWSKFSREERNVCVREHVNRLYGPDKIVIPGASTPTPDHYHGWMVDIAVEKHAVDKSFFIHIFIGNPDDSAPKEWYVDPNLVGSYGIFKNDTNHTGCEKCRDHQEEHLIVTGAIPLTGFLRRLLAPRGIFHLARNEIVPILQKELHWRIQKADGVVVEAKDVQGLKISVWHAHVNIAKSDAEFPEWDEIILNLEVTTGRDGGAAAA